MALLTTWISSLKLLLMSIGVLSIAMVMKFSFPMILDFIIYQLPSIWSFMVSWLRPPYLYVIINGIIISIAASSCFHHKDSHHNNSQIQSDLSENILKSPPLIELQTVFQSADSRPNSDAVQPVTELIRNNSVIESLETEFVISRSNWTPPLLRTSSPEIQNSEEMLVTPERPMALSRFSHRKPVKTSPEGVRGLKVAKPRRHETLENTWKTITDGRHMPLTRHFKKSDPRENHGLQCAINLGGVDESLKDAMVKKSETFIDRTSNCNSASLRTGRIRKEPSLSHEELNRRVEAFIKKFNEDMRLERQESLRQYMEMIGRGAS